MRVMSSDLTGWRRICRWLIVKIGICWKRLDFKLVSDSLNSALVWERRTRIWSFLVHSPLLGVIFFTLTWSSSWSLSHGLFKHRGLSPNYGRLKRCSLWLAAERGMPICMCVEEYEQVRRSNREIFETKARAKTKKNRIVRNIGIQVWTQSPRGW